MDISELTKVKMLDDLANAKLVERDQLLTLATKVTPTLDDMPHGTGVCDKVANFAVRMAMLSEEADKLIDLYVDQKNYVIHELERLPQNEFDVMYLTYIKYKNRREVAEIMGKSRAQIWRYHKKAVLYLARTT